MEHTPRKRKKDKRRKNFELNGKYSKKHVRQQEQRAVESQSKREIQKNITKINLINKTN